jgi:tripartite-type tricarboxylate transporter receptor subunit TctC
MAWFANQNNLKMEHVPYKGLVQALQDMIAGRLDVMYAVIGGALPFVQSNKVKAIAQSGSARSSIIPNVPTFTEAGFPAFDASFYFALAAPAGTPREIVARLATDASEIVRSAEFREKYLTNLGFEPVGDTPDQFAAFLVNDRKLGAEKVKVSGAKLD